MNRSADYFKRALRVTPGGVHSPVRSFKNVDNHPLFMEAAAGTAIHDADGQCYTDYCMAFGPLILGHRDPQVAAAVHEAVDNGWSYGTAERWSLELAELINSYIPWAQQIRFVNSGTEAVMSALRVARAATGRSLVLKFAGCYHGHSDAMLIAAGSGMVGVPASDGVTPGTAADTLIINLNDTAALQDIFTRHGDRIAAVIIEPLPANNGLLPQPREFLQAVAAQCRAHGSLLIFDEVISGFRCGFGGYSAQLGIQPDLLTWGKIIGGGFPVGAFAGGTKLMQRVAPAGAVYQAGTLSANPVAMRAGLATLHKLVNGDVYQHLERLGTLLDAGLAEQKHLAFTRHNSLFWLRPKATDAGVITERFAEFFKHMLAAGIYLPPSPHEVAFLSAAHNDSHIAHLIEAARSWQPS